MRGEVFDDPDGVRTGVAQTLYEFTLTPILRVTPDCTLKLDLRYDTSSANVFDSTSGSKSNQSTVRVYLLYLF
jgi:hypothetical protein